MRAFVLASSAPNAHESALEKLRKLHPDPVRAVHTTSGRYNLLLDVESSSADDMITFMFTTLHEMKDIVKTRVFFSADPELSEVEMPSEMEASE